MTTAAGSGAVTPRLAHMKPLDGLRGVAVLTVVLYHFSPDIMPGGFLGVDVFFVLSGFLITSLLVTERAATGRTRLREFWIRRARRLFPALLLVLVATGLYAAFVANALEVDRLRDDGLAVLGYFANWHFIDSGQSYIDRFLAVEPSPLRHAWSLAIEEQFYVVWPLVVAVLGLLVARQRRSVDEDSIHRLRRILAGLCIALALASALAMGLQYEDGTDPSRVYYGTDTHAHLILIGAALGAISAGALQLVRRVPRSVVIIAGHVAAGLLALAFVLVDTDSTWLYRGGYFAVALAVVTVIAAAGQPGAHPLGRVLSNRPLVGLGLISYGVYLWHWPAVIWLSPGRTGLDGVALFIVRAGFTIVLSLASYFIVEQPIRRGALRQLSPVLPRVLTPAAVLLVAALFVAAAEARPPLGVDLRPSAESAPVTAAYEAAPRCERDGGVSRNPIPSNAVVELLGNSLADEIVPCLRQILERQGMLFRATTQNGAGLCDLSDHVRSQAEAGLVPDIGIVYAIPVSITPCSGNLPDGRERNTRFVEDVRFVVDAWLGAGTEHIVLVPPVLPAGTSGESPVAADLRAIATASGGRVTVTDGGVFIRDTEGIYQWRMPCITIGEPGCAGGDGVAVRSLVDGGVHMCADPAWRGGICAGRFAGGERRVASAVANAVFAVSTPEPPSRARRHLANIHA